MLLEIATPARLIVSTEVDEVVAPGTEGYFGVLPGHEPTLAQMEEAGVVRIDATNGSRLTVAVHGGFLSITPEGVTVLAEFAEMSEEIDVSRARKALERADASDPEGVAAAKRAQARLRAAGEAE